MKKQETNKPVAERSRSQVPLLAQIIIYLYLYFSRAYLFIKKGIPSPLKRIYNLISIQFCIWEAKSLHKLTNQQYYVIKAYGKIRVMSCKQINYYRRKRTLSKSIDYYKLQELCIFKTQ